MGNSEYDPHRQMIEGGIRKLQAALDSLDQADNPKSFALRVFSAESALSQIETGLQSVALNKAQDLGVITMPARQRPHIFEGSLDLVKLAERA